MSATLIVAIYVGIGYGLASIVKDIKRRYPSSTGRCMVFLLESDFRGGKIRLERSF